MTKLVFDVEEEKPNDLWTTERLIDELFLNLAYTKCEIKVIDKDNRYKAIHYKKYYRQMLRKIYRIPLWRPAPCFVIYTSDLNEAVKIRLDDYYRTGNRSMFSYVVTQAVARLFENFDIAYFHASVMKNLKVVFK